MKTKAIVVTVLFLAFGLLVGTLVQAHVPPPNPSQRATAPAGPIPPAIQAGIKAMVSSKSSLENAGNNLGGHEQKAIQLIDEALKACGQTPAPASAGANSSPVNGTAAAQAALRQLTAAKNHFTNAKNPWGGRRDQALALINQALQEVQSGIAFAKNSSNGSNIQQQATNGSNIQQQATNGSNIQQQATNSSNVQQQQQTAATAATNSNNIQQQQQTTAASTSPTIQPMARNMKEFRKLPEGAARAQKFDKNFGEAKKQFKYGDGSSLTLKMVKKPAFGGQGTDIKPKVSPDKAKKPEHSTDAKGQQWTCTTEHVQLTATSTTFLNNDYSGSASHIYPGASYTFEDFYNGSYKEQTGQRNPIAVMTDSTNIKGSSFVTVSNPNMGTIRNAVDSLFRETTNAVASESLTYQIYETANDADQSIKISGGASGYGGSLSAGYSNASQGKTVYLTIDAIRTLFSINTIPPQNGFFTDPQVEATPNLMVIGSVSYGVRVLANLSVTFNSQQEEADFKAAYSGFGVSANVAFDQISKSKSVSSTINAYVVGGPGNSTLSFDKKDLEAQIKKIMSGATYKNAMPVKYEFYDMAGDVVGSNSATDSFAVRQCTPGKDDPRLESVTVEFQVGDDNKNPDDNYTLLLYPGRVNLDNPQDLQDYVFAYNQSSTPEAGLEYGPNTTYTVKLEQVKPATLSQFTKNGGALELSIFPNGNDTWKNKSVSVILSFEGGLGPNKPIVYSNVNIDQDGPHLILYFDGGFNALQN
jgi:thiol-activated cytolysin